LAVSAGRGVYIRFDASVTRKKER